MHFQKIGEDKMVLKQYRGGELPLGRSIGSFGNLYPPWEIPNSNVGGLVPWHHWLQIIRPWSHLTVRTKAAVGHDSCPILKLCQTVVFDAILVYCTVQVFPLIYVTYRFKVQHCETRWSSIGGLILPYIPWYQHLSEPLRLQLSN